MQNLQSFTTWLTTLLNGLKAVALFSQAWAVSFYLNCLVVSACRCRHPVVTVNALFFLLPSLLSFFLSNFSTEFALTSVMKWVQSTWTFNTMCRIVSIHVPALFGNLTYRLKNYSVSKCQPEKHWVVSQWMTVNPYLSDGGEVMQTHCIQCTHIGNCGS